MPNPIVSRPSVPWERGVGATAGCATGAAAAAIVAARMAPSWPERSVVLQPGGSVEVAWRDRDLTLDIRGSARATGRSSRLSLLSPYLSEVTPNYSPSFYGTAAGRDAPWVAD
jgi:hypothetical protein